MRNDAAICSNKLSRKVNVVAAAHKILDVITQSIAQQVLQNLFAMFEFEKPNSRYSYQGTIFKDIHHVVS